MARQDHFAHLVKSERNVQRVLRATLAGETRVGLLRLQCPEGMPLPGTLGNWDALTSVERERLEMAVASANQTYVNAHCDDTLEELAVDFLAARKDTLDLLRQFTDEQLAAPMALVVGEQVVGDVFAGRAGHATQHMTWIEEGFRQGV